MSLTKQSIHNEIISFLLKDTNSISNINFITRIKQFENLLIFINQNKISIKKELMLDTKTKVSKNKVSVLLYEIIENNKIINFIFEYGYIDDLKNASSYDELYTVYSDCVDYLKLSENSAKYSEKRSNNSDNWINCNIFSNAISIGSNSASSNQNMSRYNSHVGLQSVDFIFNPF